MWCIFHHLFLPKTGRGDSEPVTILQLKQVFGWLNYRNRFWDAHFRIHKMKAQILHLAFVSAAFTGAAIQPHMILAPALLMADLLDSWNRFFNWLNRLQQVLDSERNQLEEDPNQLEPEPTKSVVRNCFSHLYLVDATLKILRFYV